MANGERKDDAAGKTGGAATAEGEADDHKVVALTRWRAALTRARRGHRLDALLDAPDPERLIPALPVQEFYYILKETGLHDAKPALQLASGEQVRGVLDFELWDKDQLAEGNVGPWLDALCDLGPAGLLRHARELDPELLALIVQKRLRVVDLTLEEPPEEPEGHFYPTPDRFFLLDVLGDGPESRRTEHFIDWLYRGDLHFAKQVLMAARWEQTADLEEWSYRWRQGRMADLGFIDYYDALDVYRWLDPADVLLDEASAEATFEPARVVTLPSLLADSMGGSGFADSFFGQALAAVADEAQLERLQGALVTLTNRVMAADRAEAGDPDAAAATLARVVETVGLGLEYLTRGDAAKAAVALAGVALLRLFRLGFSLGLKLKRAADALVDKGGVTLVRGKASLLEAPLADAVEGLRQRLPAYATVLDGPPAARAGERRAATRSLRTLADLARLALALEEAASLGPLLVQGLGVEARLLEAAQLEGVMPERAAIHFSTLVATLAAQHLLGRPLALVPLTRADLAQLRKEALLDGDDATVPSAPRLRPTARLSVERAIRDRLDERDYAAPHSLGPLTERAFARLAEALAPTKPDPRFIDGVLVRLAT